MLPRQELPHPSITALVVDAVDVQAILGHVIRHGEEMELADEPRRQVLGDERFVLEVAHREVERGFQSLPTSCGNHSRSSASGDSQMRRRSRNIAKPSAYGLSPL
jgi:hypothetical protein